MNLFSIFKKYILGEKGDAGEMGNLVCTILFAKF